MWKWLFKRRNIRRVEPVQALGSVDLQSMEPLALQGHPEGQVFTVSDLLEWFVSLVVSGGGFSSQQSAQYYQKAAAALGVEPHLVKSFNLGDMRQLTSRQKAY
jgi:hypothetical protein